MRLRYKKGKIQIGDRIFYQEHLRSEKWKLFRKEALKFYGYKCSKCGSTERLEVHHKHYRNIGNELLKDVCILCKSCHRQHHKKKLNTNGKKSRYMRNPHYDTTPVTYYVKILVTCLPSFFFSLSNHLNHN